MKEFYTSPELSRELAEAGLTTEAWLRSPARWCYVDDELGSHPSWRLLDACSPELVRETYCALRLDEVLHEIRSRSTGYRIDCAFASAEYCEFTTRMAGTPWRKRHYATSEVQAAGRALLSLLRERKESANG